MLNPLKLWKRLLELPNNSTFLDGHVYSSILSWSFRSGKELQFNFMFKAIQHQQIGEQRHEQDSFKSWKCESISMSNLLFSVPGVWSEQRLQSPESKERSRTRSLHSLAASIIMDTHGKSWIIIDTCSFISHLHDLPLPGGVVFFVGSKLHSKVVEGASWKVLEDTTSRQDEPNPWHSCWCQNHRLGFGWISLMQTAHTFDSSG